MMRTAIGPNQATHRIVLLLTIAVLASLSVLRADASDTASGQAARTRQGTRVNGLGSPAARQPEDLRATDGNPILVLTNGVTLSCSSQSK